MNEGEVAPTPSEIETFVTQLLCQAAERKEDFVDVSWGELGCTDVVVGNDLDGNPVVVVFVGGADPNAWQLRFFIAEQVVEQWRIPTKAIIFW